MEETALRSVDGPGIVATHVVRIIGWVTIAAIDDPETRIYIWIGLEVVTFFIVISRAAARQRALPISSHHFPERFGLLYILGLGEIMAAFLNAMSDGFGTDSGLTFFCMCFFGFLVVYCLYWVYFDNYSGRVTSNTLILYLWMFSHFSLITTAAATGAGIAYCASGTMTGSKVIEERAVVLLCLSLSGHVFSQAVIRILQLTCKDRSSNMVSKRRLHVRTGFRCAWALVPPTIIYFLKNVSHEWTPLGIMATLSVVLAYTVVADVTSRFLLSMADSRRHETHFLARIATVIGRDTARSSPSMGGMDGASALLSPDEHAASGYEPPDVSTRSTSPV